MATSPYDIFGPSPFQREPGLLLSGSSAPPVPAPSSPVPGANVVQLQAQVLGEAEPEQNKVIEKLRPGSDLHKRTIQKLKAMLKFSRDEMRKHYWRWNYNEEKLQAYVRLEDYEAVVKQWTSNNYKNVLPPEPIQVTLPYTYATMHAAATFIASVLLGRKPIFPLVATRGTETERARYMEMAVQAQLEYTRSYETLWQLIWDSMLYSFGVTRNPWQEKRGAQVRMVAGRREVQQNQLLWAGTAVTAVDPYATYPDPRVPLHEAPTRGDFFFTEQMESETTLKEWEKQGMLRWVDAGIKKARSRSTYGSLSQEENRRRVKIGVAAEVMQTPANVVGFHPLIEGTVRLVPKDWDLGDDDRSQLWKFCFVEHGEGQIMQAEPLGMIHDQHPYTVGEPASLGHDFMSLSWMDMIGSFQDVLSWLISSRMENVRTAINNQFVADPSRVDIADIRTSAIGRVIRLKQQAMGLPVKEAIMQLQTMDVTGGHLADIQTMRVLADTITGVNDNMRGIQAQGGRRSATEARMSMQAGASRLSQMAVRLSSQAFLPLAQQMIMNTQMFMPDELWVEMTGDDGQVSSKMLTPDMLIGSFNYQVSDGTLPFDKQMMLETWKEILFGIARDPELRARYDLGEIFDYVATLGGAKNIDAFKKQAMPMQLGAAANPGEQAGMQSIGSAMPAGPISAGAAAGALML